MQVDPDVCRRALASRDARFDGRFVVAAGLPAARSRRRPGELATTYCRPSCPDRPLRRDVRFFPCAASAEAAGLRPCGRCRPEDAPGWPIWSGSAGTVSRALRLIDDGALDRGDGASLAAQLGIGEADLGGLFDQHLGASPLALATSRRAHFARALLDATDLPMTDVALAAGFRSVRQLGHAVGAVFERTPGQLRAGRAARAGERAAADRAGGTVRVGLGFRPPLAWQALLEFLATRAIPGVEAVDLERGLYRRTYRAGGGGVVTVAPGGDGVIEVIITGSRTALPTALLEVVRRVRRLFDLDADPLAVAGRLGSSPALAAVLAASPGLRVPGAWEPFEVLVRAILGQQISVAAARTLAGRLVERCGEPLAAAAGELGRVFPLPAAVAAADVAAIGLPSARARSLRESAAAVARDPGLLRPAGSHAALIARLRGLPGVGPWTAEYVALRMGEPDAFPAGDLGLRRAVGGPTGAPPDASESGFRQADRGGGPTGVPPDARESGFRQADRGGDVRERELAAAAEAWRPWRAYAAVALWRSLSPALLQHPAIRKPDSRASRPGVGVGSSGVGLGKEPKKKTALEGGIPCRPSARASTRR